MLSINGTGRPEPVTRAATIAGAVSALIITAGGLARTVGWLTDDVDVNAVARQTSDLIVGAAVLWATLAPFALAWWARGKVTPLSDPRTDDGTPLVPAARDEPHAEDLPDSYGGHGDDWGPGVDTPTATVAAWPPPVPARPEPTPIGDAARRAARTDTRPAPAART